MFFIAAKVLQALVLPPSSLLILMAIGFLIVKGRRFPGILFISTGFLLLYGLSIHPASNALLAPLEASSPPFKDGAAHAHAIVVLTAGVRDLSWTGFGPEPEPSETSLERLVKGVTLYRTLHLPVVIAGGSGSPIETALREADAMAHTASTLGVPDTDIVIENRSRNTVESARAVKDMLRGNRILLVTSAFHMKRSVAMFKKQGFDVIPAPVGYRSEYKPMSFYTFIPSAGNLANSSAALSEYASLFWYGMIGDL